MKKSIFLCTAFVVFQFLLRILSSFVLSLFAGTARSSNENGIILACILLIAFALTFFTAKKIGCFSGCFSLASLRAQQKGGATHPCLLVLCVFFFALAIIVTSSEIGNIVLFFVPASAALENGLTEISSYRSIALSLFVGALIPAFGEEFLFRKIIIEELQKNYRTGKCMFLSAALFAICHLNIWQALPAFWAGFFLALIFVKTQNIAFCIFVHFVNNFFALLCLRFGFDIKSAEAPFSNPLLTAASLLTLLVCVYSINHLTENRLTENHLTRKEHTV
ncbi:MAG: hypothetical protein Ta2A_08650 [Treponemataceae bacterium]|nr:MAG: hypothetical protein Ta2A_08650 [Treponemataceae bacterium]